VLGVLDADHFIGGRMRLDRAAAERAIREHVAEPLGMTVMQAAWGIREVLDSRMADLLRRMTVERGHDPRDFALFANGGAGPSHAWVLAAELGLGRFIVPTAATAVSAFGTGNADLGFTTESPTYLRVRPGATPPEADLARVARALESASAEVRRHLAAASGRAEVRIERFAAIRFRGQTHHLDIPLSGDGFDAAIFAEATARFEREYEQLFGRGAAFSRAGYELLSIRIAGRGLLPPPAPTTRGETPQQVATRPVVFRDPDAPVQTAIWRTVHPAAGSRIDGPAIIEFPGQSVVVPPGAQALADEHGNLHVDLQGAA
jgi:N-methylhydantoinase A